MLKNKIITILLMLTLASPAIAEPEDMGSSSIPYKQPVSKRKVAKKFLLAMGGVGISSILHFVTLSLYNKVRSSIIEAAKEIPPEGETSLVTPESLTDAIKTFLEKTKWD